MKKKLGVAALLILLIVLAVWAQTIRPTRISQLRLTQLTTVQEGTMTLVEGDIWENITIGCIRYRLASSTVCLAEAGGGPSGAVLLNPTGSQAILDFNLSTPILNNIRVVDGNKFTTIQAAIDDVPSAGGLVFVPAGTYTVSSTILLKSNLHLVGAGRAATIIQLANTTNIDVIQAPNGTTDISVSALTVDGNRANQTSTTIAGISILSSVASPSSRAILRDLYVLNVRDDGIRIDGGGTDILITQNIVEGVDIGAGIQLATGTDTSTRITASNNIVRNTQEGGITSTGPITHLTVSGNVIDTTVTADCITGYHQDNAFITVTGNICRNSGNHGIHVTGDDISVANNIIENPAQSGIFLSHSNETPPSQATRNSVANNSISGGVFGINTTNIRSASLIGNVINGSSNTGIQFTVDTTAGAGDFFAIVGNIIRGVTTNDGIALRNGVNSGLVSGNVIEGSGRDGIRIADAGTGNTNIIVALNRATGNTGFGIRELNNASGNVFSGNYLAGNTGGAKSLLTNGANFETEDLLVAQGIAADGGGFKHARVTTGSIAAGARASIVITWTTAFADTNYTPTVSVLDTSAAGTGIIVERIREKLAASIRVQVLNESAGALTGTLQAIAVHD